MNWFRDLFKFLGVSTFRKHGRSAHSTPAGFAYVSAGWFKMGDTFCDEKLNNVSVRSELPVHRVHTKAFYMAVHPVTKDLWDQVRMWGEVHGYDDLENGFSEGPQHPVSAVDWYSALKWCNARSEMEGVSACYYVGSTVYRSGQKIPECRWEENGYRLPTEAEWEKAARGGLVANRFPWGDTISHDYANYCCTKDRQLLVHGPLPYDMGRNSGPHPRYSSTSPIGQFAGNGYGLYDMAGNVANWCWDGFQDYSGAEQKDPRIQPNASSEAVIRGGSFSANAWFCRVACRDSSRLDYIDSTLGFRVVRSSVERAAAPIPQRGSSIRHKQALATHNGLVFCSDTCLNNYQQQRASIILQGEGATTGRCPLCGMLESYMGMNIVGPEILARRRKLLLVCNACRMKFCMSQLDECSWCGARLDRASFLTLIFRQNREDTLFHICGPKPFRLKRGSRLPNEPDPGEILLMLDGINCRIRNDSSMPMKVDGHEVGPEVVLTMGQTLDLFPDPVTIRLASPETSPQL